MYQIHCLNKIAAVGTNRLGANYELVGTADQADAILVRSASMHEMEFPQSLLAIARAGAGVNNIPLDRCSEEGIVVFNTPGANANAVKELCLAGMLLAARNIPAGLQWADTLIGTEGVGKTGENVRHPPLGKSSGGGGTLREGEEGADGLSLGKERLKDQ